MPQMLSYHVLPMPSKAAFAWGYVPLMSLQEQKKCSDLHSPDGTSDSTQSMNSSVQINSSANVIWCHLPANSLTTVPRRWIHPANQYVSNWLHASGRIRKTSYPPSTKSNHSHVLGLKQSLHRICCLQFCKDIGKSFVCSLTSEFSHPRLKAMKNPRQNWNLRSRPLA